MSLLDECGGHTREYHFHERLSCLYDGATGGHSPKVTVGTLTRTRTRTRALTLIDETVRLAGGRGE